MKKVSNDLTSPPRTLALNLTLHLPDADPVVSVQLWIYFALTVPVTALIVGFWLWFDKRRDQQHKKADEDLEKDMDKMEKDIMHALRKKTMSKANTWNSISSPVRP